MPIELHLGPELLAALDAYAGDAEGAPSRPELIERVLRDWLITNGYFPVDPIEALNDDTEQMAP